jgi:hypothetical protein
VYALVDDNLLLFGEECQGPACYGRSLPIALGVGVSAGPCMLLRGQVTKKAEISGPMDAVELTGDILLPSTRSLFVKVGHNHGGIWRTMHCRLCINCYGTGKWVVGGGGCGRGRGFRNN